MNRRRFIQSSAAALALASMPRFARAASSAISSGPRFRTALIGCGWWGNNILREAMASGACQIVGLSDVDARPLPATLARVRRATGDTPKTFTDYRDMLTDTKPEIVIVATPDHWHALPTIDAVKSGAHVYVEKPIAHTILEGRAMVNAARAAGRIVQVGTHRRVSPHNISAREFIRNGGIGDLGMVRCFVNYSFVDGPEEPRAAEPIPKGLDWERWCGPAPLRPFHSGIHPIGFRQYLDYANGMLGDWGVHWLDQVRWITGENHATRIYSTGGRSVAGAPVLTDDLQTSDAPDHQLATYSFGRFDVQWEHRLFGGHGAEKGENVGCHFHGSKGVLHLGWQQGWTFYPLDSDEPVVSQPAQLGQPDDQNIKELWADFIDAIRHDRPPVCDIEDLHYSTNLALLGMLSWKHGRSIEWDAKAERVIGDEAANKLLRRNYRSGYEYPIA